MTNDPNAQRLVDDCWHVEIPLEMLKIKFHEYNARFDVLTGAEREHMTVIRTIINASNYCAAQGPIMCQFYGNRVALKGGAKGSDITLGMLKKKYSEFMKRRDAFEMLSDSPAMMVIGDIINAANMCQFDDDYVVWKDCAGDD